MEGVELRYRKNTPLVLKGLTMNFKSGQKVGVVGRTGAGKSTLGLTVLRILELEQGKIMIDGEDISKLYLSELRNKITTIPQDPVLFKGTLRFNIDPQDKFTDA